MKIIPYVIVGALTYGCGAQKLAINNADTILSHQITKRMPLYSEQKTQLNKDLDKLLNSAKPKAQDLLPIFDELKLKESESIRTHYKKLQDFYNDVALQFSELMAKYLAQLDSKQQKDFFENLDDENRDLQKKDLKSRLEKIEDRIEIFIGSLTPSQKQIIVDYGPYFDDRLKSRIVDRKILQQDFREIFADETSTESKEERIVKAFKNYQKKRTSDEKTLEIIDKFLPTLKDSQHERLREKAKEIKSLIRYYLEVDY